MSAGLILAIGLAFACSGLAAPAAQRPPNFIVILADDLGYADLGCYGSERIATPHLDRMAREGTRFTDFYVAAPFCSPSRAALLTGRLPARCGVPYVLFPAEHTGLPPDEVTVAELLKPRGYATACIGKWHLGWDPPFRPTRQGFDEFFGLPYSNDSNEWPVGEPFMQVMGLQPLPLVDGKRVVEAPVDQATLTQRYTQRAVEFIRRHRDRPFFLYLPHTMPHIPQFVSPEFAGKSRDGLYGDCVQELDWSTGIVLNTLRELDLAENTLVLFTSDNGANARPPTAIKAKSPVTKARFPGRSLGGSNAPFRAGKGTTFEGGLRVPFIAWRPGKVPAGSTNSAPLSALDLFPTLVELAGAPRPERTLDGQSMAALLRGESKPSPTRPLFHYFGAQLQAVREGPWKLFLPVNRLPDPKPVSLWFDHQPQVFERQHRLWPKPTLHHLGNDPGEAKDVAMENPAVVERLLRLARDFEAKFQPDVRPLEIVPGPKPPAPGQIRRVEDDLSAWR